MSWDDFDETDDWDTEDEENSEPLILSIGEDGKPNIHKSSDYVEILEKDFKLIQGFLEEQKDLFNEYIKKNDALSEYQENHSQQVKPTTNGEAKINGKGQETSSRFILEDNPQTADTIQSEDSEVKDGN